MAAVKYSRPMEHLGFRLCGKNIKRTSSALQKNLWWFQPPEKICLSNCIISPGGDEIQKYLKPPPTLFNYHLRLRFMVNAGK